MAKKSKGFLPKKIAGVKVPKKVRKGQFGELLASKTGQALIAQALLAAGAVAGAKKAADSPKARGALADFADKVKSAGDGAGSQVSEGSSAMTYALGEAVRTFAEALHRGRPEAQEPVGEPAGADPEAKKKTTEGMEPRPL
ncbi:MAG: hypothetical protein ACJ798_01535 [Phenylobacterium sp.]